MVLKRSNGQGSNVGSDTLFALSPPRDAPWVKRRLALAATSDAGRGRVKLTVAVIARRAA
jgi:hypothetical protein